MSSEANIPAGKPPYKRKTLIINKAFQYKFITIVVACVAVAMAIIALDMFSSLGRYVAAADASADPAAVYRDSWIAFTIKGAFYMLGVFIVALALSHKIAGPVYRFEKSCEEVALGNLTYRAFIRKGDEWGGFRETFNGMVAALQEKVGEDAARVQAARRLLEELSGDAALPGAAREKARKALAEVSSVGSRFKLS